jgi:hypothetical protein
MKHRSIPQMKMGHRRGIAFWMGERDGGVMGDWVLGLRFRV